MPDYIAMNRSGRTITGDSAQPAPDGFVWIPCPLGSECPNLEDGEARQIAEGNHYHEAVAIDAITNAPGPTYEQWQEAHGR